MDKIESCLSEAERRVYREEKVVNGLFRDACKEDEGASRGAMQALRKVFHEKKRAIVELQRVPTDTRDFAELGRLSNLCRSIVALFNDQGWGLTARRPTSANQAAKQADAQPDVNHPSNRKFPRTYQGME